MNQEMNRADRRVLMVCTRNIRPDANTGRERTMAFIHSALSEAGTTRVVKIDSLLEERSIRRIVGLAAKLVAGLLKREPLPLQSLLFYDARYEVLLEREVLAYQPDCVYFDGIRSGIYAPFVKRRFPKLRVVCDFDDLMSHRMEVLAETGEPLSLGYLKRFVPEWVQKYIVGGLLSKGVLKYERNALMHTESRVASACNAVVLVSTVEGEKLRSQVSGSSVEVIPPVIAGASADVADVPITRFIFIGSDGLVQNRLTIEYLVNLWSETRPAVPLHIYGKQNNRYRAVEGVRFEGFVQDVAEVYTAGSIMLAPSFVRGGVKTKILEAMSYGNVPVGNDITFEGIQADCAALIFNDAQLRNFVQEPQLCKRRLLSEGALAIDQVRVSHSVERVGSAWVNVVWQ
jgi:glycosyltransferase involved in cell wall biosynthesis